MLKVILRTHDFCVMGSFNQYRKIIKSTVYFYNILPAILTKKSKTFLRLILNNVVINFCEEGKYLGNSWGIFLKKVEN